MVEPSAKRNHIFGALCQISLDANPTEYVPHQGLYSERPTDLLIFNSNFPRSGHGHVFMYVSVYVRASRLQHRQFPSPF